MPTQRTQRPYCVLPLNLFRQKFIKPIKTHLAIGFLIALAFPLHAQQQFRAGWADIFHVGMQSSSQVDTLVNTLVAGHYNVVIVQVLGYMDQQTPSHGAYWKSSIVPWSGYVTSTFDPLAYLCTKAHANGIEVHAWLGGSGGGQYRVSTVWPPSGNTTLANHPEWFMVPYTNSEGNSSMPLDGNYLLDMGSPDAQEYIVSIVKELVTNYPIDGINWDDEINSTGYNQGYGYPAYSTTTYGQSGLARFRAMTGTTGTPLNSDPTWSNYRRRFKGELMARCQAEIESIKTNPRQPLRHTSAAEAYSPSPSSCNFTNTTPYTDFVDWAGMLQNGWIDAAIPQTYSISTFTNWANRCFSCWQYNRAIFPGLGAYLNTNAANLAMLKYAYSIGLNGAATYSYAVPNVGGTSDWWAYVAANLYTNTVTTPSMPWRNPATATEGIMWGEITDSSGAPVDDATVSVTGGSTVKTDGNGYYVATLVPATSSGTVHQIVASKSGLNSATNSTATAVAGDVMRYDLTLTFYDPPSITSNPQSDTTLQGQSVFFTVTATGTAPLNYRWQKNAANLTDGSNISGSTTSTLTIRSAGLSDVASYSVIVSNITGVSVTSSAAALTVVSNVIPVVSMSTNAAGGFTVTWQTDVGTTYTAQSKQELTDTWTSSGSFTANSSTSTFNFGPTGSSHYFYQLISSDRASDPIGFLNLSLLGNSDTFVSMPFVRPGGTRIMVSSVSGNAVAADGSPNWTPNQFVYSSGTQSNTYYARFVSGAMEGRLYQIIANSANGITLSLGLDTLSSVAAGDFISIEPYWTLNTVFPNGAGVNASPTPGNRYTEVLIPNTSGTGINLSAAKIYYFNAGIWKQVSDGSNNHNDDILQPNSHFIVRHNVATNTTMTALGVVITSKIAVPLVTQPAMSQDNYIGLARPIAVTLNDCGLVSSGAFSASSTPGGRTDELLVFDNSVVARNKSASAVYYYWNSGWHQVGNGVIDVGTTTMSPGSGVIIRKSTNNISPVWTNAPNW